ncbi:MAG: CHAD domain-containing protein [Chitinivibrionales bacterium]|nr:CHAD domain-containing protein [Chitinivibrionales bacterium]MBD3396287.1 CHAD domain-containing protein [Chitinivibrionales bacterium]
MAAKPSIEELCARHNNEDAHTEHVTRLALRLFDRCHASLGLRPSNRPLLEAACRLHDIGYAADPAGHAATGAEIIVREGVRGFTRSRCATIARIVLLHPRRAQRHTASPALESRSHSRLARRLAAFLRVADGLDHGHIQNAGIASVRIQKRSIRLTVRSPGYAGTGHAAQAKADLWNKCFPSLPLRISLLPRVRRTPKFHGVAGPQDSVLNAARRLLMLQYRNAADNHEGTLSGGDPEHLHDFRTAFRRFRAALRLFRKRFGKSIVSDLNAEIKSLSQRLGPIRDLDVWLVLLNSHAVTGELRADPLWEPFVQNQRALRNRRASSLRSALMGPQYEQLMRSLAYFLRIHVPALQRSRKPRRFARFAAKKLGRTYERIHARASRPLPREPEDIHALRKQCRVARYYAEFCAPALGPVAHRLARRLKNITDALGTLHDMDVDLERLDDISAPAPAGLRPVLLRKRRKARIDFEKHWERLTKKSFAREINATLSRAKKTTKKGSGA